MLNVPRAVTLAAGLMIGIQVVRGLLPDETDVAFLLSLAFIPARYSGAAVELPGGYLTAVTSFVTYMVVHGGWMHLLVNVAWMLAFGTAVARRIGTRGFFVFSILCGIAGALTHLVLHWGEMAPSSPSASRMKKCRISWAPRWRAWRQHCGTAGLSGSLSSGWCSTPISV
jgi:membrane associated rhomboid family serine protease